MPADALAPKVVSVSAGMVFIGCVGQRCIVVPELNSSTWVKQNHGMLQNVNISFVIFNTVQHVKSFPFIAGEWDKHMVILEVQISEYNITREIFIIITFNSPIEAEWYIYASVN